MSDTPEQIWHQHDGKGHLADLAELAVKPVDEVQAAFTEYLRADTADAAVAAAYERAADRREDKAEIERLREALDRLRKSATLLQLNMEGCAVNHYGEDFNIHGMPGWLVDTRTDIEAARAALQETDT